MSDDFLSWTEPEPIIAPDLRDSWDVQFYGMTAFQLDDRYVGGLMTLWSTPDVNNIELVTSRDTKDWQRTRATWLDVGGPDAWDSMWVGLASSPPVEMNDALYFYYEGRNLSHEKLYPFPRGAIGLAATHRDRFVALEAGGVEGYVTTPPFTWEGGKLTVNVNAGGPCRRDRRRGRGWLRASEVADEHGEPVPGFSHDDARRIGHWNVKAEPSWEAGDPSLELLKGRTVALRIYLCNARLYAVTLER